MDVFLQCHLSPLGIFWHNEGTSVARKGAKGHGDSGIIKRTGGHA